MPLAFESLSHGTIAFGFFNIDSDMLLLDHYCFTRASFHELINYVWHGGYPRWKDEIRPDYVVSMEKIISQDPRGVFDGIRLKV
jgi:hypothetical protein